MTAEEKLLAAIDAAPGDRQAALAYARHLPPEDPRKRLIEVQCALEEAKGDTTVALKVEEHAILAAHEAALAAPLTARDAQMTWRRGFVHAVDFQAKPKGDRWRGALAKPSFRACTAIGSETLPTDLPETVERLAFFRGKLDAARLLPCARLHSLTLVELSGKTRLAHPSLAELELPGTSAGLQTILKADLPALRSLTLRDAPLSSELTTTLTRLVERHPTLRLTLEVHGRAQSLESLAPLVPHIDTLVVEHAPLGGLGALPPFRRLRLRLRDVPQSDVPDDLHNVNVDVLELQLVGIRPARSFDRLVSAAIYPRLRELRITATHVEVSPPAALPRYDKLETLAILAGGNRREDLAAGEQLLQHDVFPAVRRVALTFPQQLAPLAASSLAARVEELAINLGRSEDVATWLAVRDRFPRLTTLHVHAARIGPALSPLAGDGYAVSFLTSQPAMALREPLLQTTIDVDPAPVRRVGALSLPTPAPASWTYEDAPVRHFTQMILLREILDLLCGLPSDGSSGASFHGDARSGCYDYDSQSEGFYKISFCPAGVIGVACHWYAAELAEANGDALHYVRGAPPELLALAEAMSDGVEEAFTAGFWVTDTARHFDGVEDAAENGLEDLLAFGASIDGPFDHAAFSFPVDHDDGEDHRSEASLRVALALAARAANGGGAFSDEEARTLFAPAKKRQVWSKQAIAEAQRRLARLGLHPVTPLDVVLDGKG